MLPRPLLHFSGNCGGRLPICLDGSSHSLSALLLRTIYITRSKNAATGGDAFGGAVALAEHCTSAPLTLLLPGSYVESSTLSGSGGSPVAEIAPAPIF